MESKLTDNHITNIPELISLYGNVKKVSEKTGWSEMTVSKYKFDVDCKCHVVLNGRLYTSRKNSKVIENI